MYSFFSGDTTFLTKSASLKKAQAIGEEIYQHYLSTCDYLDDPPTVGREYFVPGRLEKISKKWAAHLLTTDADSVLID